MNKIVKNAAILTAITLVSGMLLGLVYEVTKNPISASQEKTKQEAYQKVLPSAKQFQEEELDEKKAEEALKKADVSGCYVKEAALAMDENGESVGYAVTTVSKEGYGGEIEISVGILEDGTVAGIEILSISETAGLGMNATEPAFKNQFSNIKTEKFEVKKDNPSGNVDALSGATITSKAVTSAVNAGLAYYQNVLGGNGNE